MNDHNTNHVKEIESIFQIGLLAHPSQVWPLAGESCDFL